MKTKKTFFLAFSLCILTFAFCGCSDDDDKNDEINLPSGNIETITATVTGISDLVDHVSLTCDNVGKDILVTTEFKDNKFVMELPETVDGKYLSSITSDDVFKNCDISDTSAKICSGQFWAYKDGEAVGIFNLSNAEIFAKTIYYIYTDKEVIITGEYQTGTSTRRIVNCHFLKGWNEIAFQTISSDENEYVDSWVTGYTYNWGWEYMALDI